MRRYKRSWWWFKEKKHMALVFITITMMLQFLIKGSVGCLETERMGLLQLKSYLNSLLQCPGEEGFLEPWSNDASISNSDCCLWERVKCNDAIGGHVVHLSLNEIMRCDVLLWDPSLSLNLSLLHSFPQLKTFEFSLNRITHLFDPIHGYKSFQRLENLEALDFLGNRLNNSVLPFLSAARSLRTLNLSSNKLEGVFPPNEHANMTELRVLNLQSNRFTSFSVQGLINFRELEELDLSYNHIANLVAGDGLRTTKLKTLDLSYNEFSEAARLKGLEDLVELKVLSLIGNDFNDTRSIEVLKDLPKLQELDLYGNEFTDLDSLGLVFPSSLRVLDLQLNELSSTPKGYSYICALTNLRELDLRGNALTNLPYCLGNLSRLRTLDLSENQLNGNLSFFVFGLPSALEYLSLLENNFNGSFLFKSLFNQTKLRRFKLSSKVGMIQAQADSLWVPLFQLEELKLQNVSLGSTIPSFLVHQHELGFIDLSHNKLTGAFPTWLVQNNTRLQAVFLKRNSLTKLRLPRLVHGLQVLDISSNEIVDSIQEDIGIFFPKLKYVDFSSNHFHGTFPSSVGEMKSLEKLDMSSNDLSGQLPKTFLSSGYSLIILKLSNNRFQGKIFPVHANLTSLRWLLLDGNFFSGSLGKSLLKSKDLAVLDISDNSISGSLPLWIGRMSVLSHLYMSGNQMKGPFPHQLQSLSAREMNGLQVIDISHNRFSGSIPRNLYFQYLRELRLQSNEFMGTIPDTLFKVDELEVLDLRNNNFSRMILNTIGNSSGLLVLLLGSNNFQSHIPEKICQLGQVGLLDLSHNKFKGAIPSCLGNMSFEAKMEVYIRPSFRPTFYELPTTLQQWRYTSGLNLDIGDLMSSLTPAPMVHFLTKNRDEAYQGDILNDMHGLDLSSNQLSGQIPVEIGNLGSIRSLNLSNNHLTGSIPDIISKLKDLESLDLSSNKLDGNIPPQLADLNSLGYLNVSFNNLSGEIPLKGHLLTFGEMSYIGNAHLCGLPTNKSCNPVPEPSASKQANEEEEEEGVGVIDMVWFNWTCGAVYMSSLLTLSAFLCIDSRWSREWFYRVDLLVHHLHRFKGRFVCN